MLRQTQNSFSVNNVTLLQQTIGAFNSVYKVYVKVSWYCKVGIIFLHLKIV